MNKAEKIEKNVKDKVQENVDEIVKNALQDANLKDLINNEINKQITATNTFANLIRNLTQSDYYGRTPIDSVRQILEQLTNSIQEVKTLNNIVSNIAKENENAVSKLKKTTEDAVNIKNDLSDYRDQVIDGALFSSFEERAKEYDTRAQKQEHWSIRYLLCLGCLLVVRIIFFFCKEYSEDDLLLSGDFWILLLFSASFAILLSILSYLSSNKYHMNKKLAEEYWHKASILKSFVGYKTQYQQNMEDAEYKVFFEYLVKAIMINPADKINVFLKKKLPIETILETPKNIIGGVKEVAKNVES